MPNDGGQIDIYLRRCGPTGEIFCTGDPDFCPCANAGFDGGGCRNSNGGSTLLKADGLAQVSADTVILIASDLPANAPVLFFQGTTSLSGGNGIPFGDGLRCVGGGVVRLGIKFADPGGSAVYGVGGDVPVSVQGMLPAFGGTFYYQAWYRDTVPFCEPEGFNLSNGLRITWAP